MRPHAIRVDRHHSVEYELHDPDNPFGGWRSKPGHSWEVWGVVQTYTDSIEWRLGPFKSEAEAVRRGDARMKRLARILEKFRQDAKRLPKGHFHNTTGGMVLEMERIDAELRKLRKESRARR